MLQSQSWHQANADPQCPFKGVFCGLYFSPLGALAPVWSWGRTGWLVESKGVEEPFTPRALVIMQPPISNSGDCKGLGNRTEAFSRWAPGPSLASDWEGSWVWGKEPCTSRLLVAL